MTEEEKDRKISELEKRIEELEDTLAFHWHTPLGSCVIEKGRAVWFESMGPYRK